MLVVINKYFINFIAHAVTKNNEWLLIMKYYCFIYFVYYS